MSRVAGCGKQPGRITDVVDVLRRRLPAACRAVVETLRKRLPVGAARGG